MAGGRNAFKRQQARAQALSADLPILIPVLAARWDPTTNALNLNALLADPALVFELYSL